MTNPQSEIPNPKSILITGGAGFIGSHLAEALLERGHHVTVIDNPSTSSGQRLSTGRFENIQRLTDHPRFRFAIDTITNEVVMDRLVSEPRKREAAHCDVIFHLAAAVGVELIVRDPVHVIETNILGTHIEQRSGGAGERGSQGAEGHGSRGAGGGGAKRRYCHIPMAIQD